MESMMCLRDSPLPFGPGKVGKKTLLEMTKAWRGIPAMALPITISALPSAYMSALSKKLTRGHRQRETG